MQRKETRNRTAVTILREVDEMPIENIFYVNDSTDPEIPASKLYSTPSMESVLGESYSFNTDNGLVELIGLGVIEYNDTSEMVEEANARMLRLGI